MISHLLCAGVGFILGASVMRAIAASEPERVESDREKRERWERAKWAPREDEEHG